MKKRIVLLISFLCGVCSMPIYANDEDISAIIFWDYSENLSLEILEENSLDKSLENFNTVLVIPLSECVSFSKETYEFLLIDNSTKWHNEYQEIFDNLSYRSDGGSIYFSIVIDGKIIINGLNRIGFPPIAQMMPKDELVVPRIMWWTQNDTLKLTMDHVNTYEEIYRVFSSQEEKNKYLERKKEENRPLYREEIEEYFSSRGRLE